MLKNAIYVGKERKLPHGAILKPDCRYRIEVSKPNFGYTHYNVRVEMDPNVPDIFLPYPDEPAIWDEWTVDE